MKYTVSNVVYLLIFETFFFCFIFFFHVTCICPLAFYKTSNDNNNSRHSRQKPGDIKTHFYSVYNM